MDEETRLHFWCTLSEPCRSIFFSLKPHIINSTFTRHSGLDPLSLAWSCVKTTQKLNGHELLLHNTFTVTAQLSKAHGAPRDEHHFCNWYFLSARDQCERYSPPVTTRNLIRYRVLSAETKNRHVGFHNTSSSTSRQKCQRPSKKTHRSGQPCRSMGSFHSKTEQLISWRRRAVLQSWISSFLPRTQIYPEKRFAQRLSIQHSQQWWWEEVSTTVPWKQNWFRLLVTTKNAEHHLKTFCTKHGQQWWGSEPYQ